MKLFFQVLGMVMASVLVAGAHDYQQGAVIGNVNNTVVNEASGIALGLDNPEVLWTHNDSGGGPYFYAMKTDGTVLAQYYFPGAIAQDLEDIALWRDPADGKSYIYLADTGDNREVRNNLRIYRFEEPSVNLNGSFSSHTISNFETYPVNYPDGKHDNEVLIIDPDNGDIHLATKRDALSRIYVHAQPLSQHSNNTFSYMGEMSVTALTAGDISPDGSRIIVKTHNVTWQYTRGSNQSIANALMGTPEVIPYTVEAKGESVTFNSTGDGYYTTSEGNNEPVYYYAPQNPGNTNGGNGGGVNGEDPAPPNVYQPGTNAGAFDLTIINESSGVASSNLDPEVLWTHNDKGGGPYVYATSTSGTILHRFELSGAAAFDLEDIASWTDPNTGINWIYVADTGDNSQVRTSIRVYRFMEPVLGFTAFNLVIDNFETINLQYPDGSHDNEVLIVDPDTGDIYLATKRDALSRIYRCDAPYASGVNTLTYLGDMQVTGLTAGDIRDDGREILFKTHNEAWRVLRDPATQSIADAMKGTPEPIPYTAEPKGEAIGFDINGCGYYTTSEGNYTDITYYPSSTCTSAPPSVAVDILPISGVVKKEYESVMITPVLATDIPGVIYTISGAPPGSRFTTSDGSLTWRPGESDGGTTHSITITATDPNDPTNTDSETVVVSIVEENEPPLIGAISKQETHVGDSITVIAAAMDLDLPAQNLTFFLDTYLPGASIDPFTGEFTYTPPLSSAGQSTTVTIGVFDSGSPAQYSYRSFTIVSHAPIKINCTETPTGALLDWNAIAGHKYRLEAVEELPQPFVQWSPIATITSPGSIAQHLDTVALTTEVRCFYRVAYLGE